MGLMACSETQLIDYWKNPEIVSYSPEKVLVVGITANNQAKSMFEIQLKTALEERGIKAAKSIDIAMFNAQNGRISQTELDSLEINLLNQGFDTILLSSVVGVEDKIAYKSNYDGFDDNYSRFKEDYLRYQDVFYNPDYYDEYTIYHAETSMYCICPTKDRELIWKGYFEITDPRQLDKTIDQYVNLVILALEELNLLDSVDMSLEPETEVL